MWSIRIILTYEILYIAFMKCIFEYTHGFQKQNSALQSYSRHALLMRQNPISDCKQKFFIILIYNQTIGDLNPKELNSGINSERSELESELTLFQNLGIGINEFHP